MKILSLFMTSYCSLNSRAKNPSLRVSGLSAEYYLVVPLFSLMFTIGLLLPPSPSQGHHQPNIILIFQAGAHGTDISTGNQPGIPSLPAGGATPDAGSTASPSQAGVCPAPEGSYCPDNSGLFPSYPGLGLAGGHDRNHNTALPSQLASKAGEVTESGSEYSTFTWVEESEGDEEEESLSEKPWTPVTAVGAAVGVLV